MGGSEKHFKIGERFVARRPIVPLSTIIHEHARVKNDLVSVINHLFSGLRHGVGVGLRNCVIYLPLDDLNGVGGSVRLAEALIVRNLVRVCNHGIFCVQMGEQIQSTRSAVSQV